MIVARFLRIGPDRATGRPVIELELDDGQIISVVLDPAHGRTAASRLAECVDGRISARPPSRRVLQIELVSSEGTDAHSPTEPAPAAESA